MRYPTYCEDAEVQAEIESVLGQLAEIRDGKPHKASFAQGGWRVMCAAKDGITIDVDVQRLVDKP